MIGLEPGAFGDVMVRNSGVATMAHPCNVVPWATTHYPRKGGSTQRLCTLVSVRVSPDGPVVDHFWRGIHGPTSHGVTGGGAGDGGGPSVPRAHRRWKLRHGISTSWSPRVVRTIVLHITARFSNKCVSTKMVTLSDIHVK